MLSFIHYVRMIASFISLYFLTFCNNTIAADSSIVYIQGMNVIAAVFLHVMPELDAFHCFETLITQHCPAYFYSSSVRDAINTGCEVRAACQFVSICLRFVLLSFSIVAS